MPEQPLVHPVEPGAAGARVWEAFRAAESASGYCERWLEYLHLQLPQLTAGAVLVAGGDDAPLAPLARWPEHIDLGLLAPCAQALADGGGAREVVMPAGAAGMDALLGFPVRAGGELVAMAVFGAAGAGRDDSLRQSLRWSMAWLELLFLRRASERSAPRDDAVFSAFECVASVIDTADFQAAANGLCTELATLLECDRVSLGLARDRGVELAAVSHTALFGEQMNLVRLLEAAMDEALDQQCVVTWPPPADSFLVTAAHDALAQEAAESALCTVPLHARGQAVGALALERDESRPFDERTVELVEVVAALTAAPLTDRREAERFIGALALERARRQLERLLGRGYIGRKLAAAGMLALVAFLSFATGAYRITADALLQGAEQRAVTAPIDGYIDSAPARAGDRLEAGAPLISLDDRELQLQRLRTATERNELVQQHKLAVASGERANAKVLEAQIEQADARLALLEEQIARTRIRMPFDGVVVSGDFSQSLGAPVRRGEVLYELAPTDRYRVVLEVDERELDEVAPGAGGRVLLNALPETPFPLQVTRITPVTKAREGGNFFEVEGELAEDSPRLKPGMRGVGKIDAGERRLAWIWTRGLRDWLRLQWWRWFP